MNKLPGNNYLSCLGNEAAFPRHIKISKDAPLAH